MTKRVNSLLNCHSSAFSIITSSHPMLWRVFLKSFIKLRSRCFAFLISVSPYHSISITSSAVQNAPSQSMIYAKSSFVCLRSNSIGFSCQKISKFPKRFTRSLPFCHLKGRIRLSISARIRSGSTGFIIYPLAYISNASNA